MSRAINSSGLTSGDVVSLQISLGRLGPPIAMGPDYSTLSIAVIETFLEAIGPEGTLVVPTFSYSIGKGETFVVEETPAQVGEFAEIFRRYPGVIRSRDPMLSHAALGPQAPHLTREISNSCYGHQSTFHRLRELGGKICVLGVSLYWATFLHHIEFEADVPFRFRKTFVGQVQEHGHRSEEVWEYYAAARLACCQSDPKRLEEKVRRTDLLRTSRIGKGEIGVIEANQYFSFGLGELRKDPWLTAKGPPQLITDADRR